MGPGAGHSLCLQPSRSAALPAAHGRGHRLCARQRDAPRRTRLGERARDDLADGEAELRELGGAGPHPGVRLLSNAHPFAWVNAKTTSTAAAAGGCMLVERHALERAGGVSAI